MLHDGKLGKGWSDGITHKKSNTTKKKKYRPGKRTRSIRRSKWKKDPHCKYCGKKLLYEETTLDHVIPHSKGGGTNHANCVIACRKCNEDKADKLPEGIVCVGK